MEHLSKNNTTFYNAQEAFEFYYDEILSKGKKLDNTLFMQNIGFYIENPLDRNINTYFRKWKNSYAELEWEWYLSANRSVEDIKKHAKIWDKMHSGDNIVNSNYGYQWNRSNQIGFIIYELSKNPNSRRAVLTIYDGKEHLDHVYDTPCTLNIVFSISEKKLNMSVLMRSNDLWFGFCNDQYCFSKLQELIGNKLNIDLGWYYHFANNIHLYDIHHNKLKFL
jgi:thymidylate synthase